MTVIVMRIITIIINFDTVVAIYYIKRNNLTVHVNNEIVVDTHHKRLYVTYSS